MHGRRSTACTAYPPKHPSRTNTVQRSNHPVERRQPRTLCERNATIPPLTRDGTRRIGRMLEVRDDWTHEPQLPEPQPNTSSQRTVEIHCRDNQVQLPTDYNVERQLCRQQEPLDHEGRIRSANHSQLLGESGKRAGLVSVELEVTLTTQPHSNQNEAGVLGCEEASSRDEVKPSNNTYTLDPNILLACPESIIMDLYHLGSEDEQ
jgi:hypothetical protein